MLLAVFFLFLCQGLLTDRKLGQSKEHENESSDMSHGNKSAKLWSCRSGPFENRFENRFENAIKVETIFEELGLKTKLKTKAKTGSNRLL